MSCAALYNDCFYQGSTYTLVFTLTNLGSPVSLSGATITATLYKDTDQASPDANFSCSVVDGPLGIGQIVLSAATTEALTYDPNPEGERNATTFLYSILVALPSGVVIAPLAGVLLGYPTGPQ